MIIYTIIKFLFISYLIAVLFLFILFISAYFFLPQNKLGLGDINKIIDTIYINNIELNDELSSKILFRFLTKLDKIDGLQLFTKDDIQEIKKKYNNIIDNNLKNKDLSFSKNIFNTLINRVDDRIIEINEILNNQELVNYTENEYISQNDEKKVYKKDYQEYWLEEEDRKKSLLKYIKYQSLINSKDILQIKYTINLFKNYKKDKIKQMIINSFLYYLDPHTKLLKYSKIFNNSSSYGLGIMVNIQDELIVIQDIIKGGPADNSGKIKIGDIILSIVEKNKEINIYGIGLDLNQVINIIKGKKNTDIKLKVKHTDNSTEYVNITRGVFINNNSEINNGIIRNILHYDKKKIGIIKFNSFDTNTATEIKKELIELKRLKIDGLILDIRDNGGGLLTSVIEILDMFIDTGIALKYKDPLQNTIVTNNMNNPGKIYDGPLSILVNSNSASASEVLAGVIQYYKRGIIIGTSDTTFGKGVIQAVIPLLNNNIFKLTTASYHLPNGITPQFEGIKCDLKIYDDISSLLKKDDNYGYEKYLPNATQTENLKSSEIIFDNSFNNLDEIKKYYNSLKIINEFQKLIKQHVILLKEVSSKKQKIPLNQDKIKIYFDDIKIIEKKAIEALNMAIKEESNVLKISDEINNSITYDIAQYISGLITLKIKK